MEKGTVVTLVLNNGAEIVGKFVEETFSSIVINRPKIVQVTQQGVGLVNGISMTGIEPKGNFDFAKTSVLYYIETSEEVANGWTSQTSGIALPQKGLVS